MRIKEGESPIEIELCTKCPKAYVHGEYAEHVRNSPASRHDHERTIYVDMKGNVTREKYRG